MSPTTAASRELLSLQDSQSLLRWMKCVIRNRIRDLSRGRHEIEEPSAQPDLRNKELGRDDSISELDFRGVERDALHREEAARILLQLGSLPAEEQLCLVMHDVARLPWSPVAAALGRSVAGAKCLRNRAKARVRNGS